MSHRPRKSACRACVIGGAAGWLSACGAGTPSGNGHAAGAEEVRPVTAEPTASATAMVTPAPVCPDEAPGVEVVTRDGTQGRFVKMHPAVTKAYRVDVCYWGTLDIELARDSYLQSLQGAEPSEKAIPRLPRRSEPSSPIAYERNARACEVARTLKEPATPMDAALSEYAPFVLALTKDLAEADRYYSAQQYQQDGFSKGKELHARLTQGFAQLDKQRGRMTGALMTYEAQRPTAVCEKEENARIAQDCFEKARVVMRHLGASAGLGSGARAGLGDLTRCVETVAAGEVSAQAPEATVWSKMMTPSLKSFSGYASQVAMTAEGRIDSDSRAELSGRFISVVESRYRTTSRVAMRILQGPSPAWGGASP